MKAMRSNDRRRKRLAFTLIELLVVIAVIAILAALLLPVLAGAKRRATLAQCQNNFHQIYVACYVYANTYDDYFPPTVPPLASATIGGIDTPEAALYAWYPANWPGTITAGIPIPRSLGASRNGWFQNLGYLYATHGIGDGRALFCPGFPDMSLFSAARYSNPSFMSADTDGLLRSTMLFNPHVVDPAGPYSYSDARLFPKTSSIIAGKLFGTDCLQMRTNYAAPSIRFSLPAFTPDTFAHYPSKGFNVLFTDGSAEFVQNVIAFKLVASGGHVVIGGNPYWLGYDNISYSQFYPLLEEAR